jgi:branched-chain amino acid transport system permease protein
MARRSLILLLVGFILALFAPQLLGTFWASLIMQILIFGLLALSVDLLLGHTGMFSLCHAAFFAVAAYTTAILQVRYGQPTLIAAPAGIFVGFILSLIYGLAVRTSGVYFILVTIAMGYIIWGVAVRWGSFTGGDNGIGNIPFPAVGPLTITNLTSYYYVVWIMTGLGVLGYRLLIQSPFGLTLRGIRDSESRMRGLGYNVGRHKYAAFVLSGCLASFAGVLYIYFNRFISPATSAFPIYVEAALMVIIGGVGTVVGPFIGSAVFLIMRNYVSAYLDQWMTITGLVFIATVLWAPNGFLGLLKKYRSRPKNPNPRVQTGKAG